MHAVTPPAIRAITLIHLCEIGVIRVICDPICDL
jgi:hypothetical protein